MNDEGLTASNGEARRLIKQGGVKLNGEKNNNADMEVEASGEVVIQAGKRRFARVIFA
jgi:tyrosyl-tRNA synthetase